MEGGRLHGLCIRRGSLHPNCPRITTVKEEDVWISQQGVQRQPALARCCGQLALDRLERVEPAEGASEEEEPRFRLPPRFPGSGESVPKGIESGLPGRALPASTLRIYVQKRRARVWRWGAESDPKKLGWVAR